MILNCTLSIRAQQSSPLERRLERRWPLSRGGELFKPGVARWNQPVTGAAIDNIPYRIFVVSSGEQLTEAGSLILGPDGVTTNLVRDPAARPLEHPTHEHLILVLNADGKVIEDWSQ